jgi:opacity protein-like surface antigen
MSMKAVLLGAAAIVAMSGTAAARGWYVGLEAGPSLVADTDAVYRLPTVPFTTRTEGKFDTGWALIATVGYAMQNWRIEGELSWRSNDKDQFIVGGPSTGSLDELTAMYNMTYQLPLAQGVGVAIGGGAGLDYAMIDIPNVDDSDLNWAVQGIVQLNYALSDDTELTLGYRYLHVLDPEFEDDTALAEVTFEDFSKQALTIGVRYTFAP